MPQYFCQFCLLSYCVNCGDNSKAGAESYIHPHNIIFIDVDSFSFLDNIEEFRIGKKARKCCDIKKSHSAACNGCGKNIIGFR